MSNDLRWLIGSDFHIPYEDPTAMSIWWQVMEWFKPDVIDILGDLDDNSACSKYSDGTADEVINATAMYSEFVKQFFAKTRELNPDSQIHFATGNHECSGITKTRVVTKSGLKAWDEVKPGMLALSVDDDGKSIWQPIEDVRVYLGEHEVYKIDERNVRGTFTPNHRMMIKTSYNKPTIEKRMDEVAKRGVTLFTCAGESNNEDARYTDDEIRLLAWCLTDSHISRTGQQWFFYQSEPKQERIKSLLDSLGIDFVIKKRQRDTTEICGKILKSVPQPSYEFITSTSDIPWSPDTRQNVPDAIHEFSQRQFDIFIEEYVFTDGTKPSGGDSVVLYCSDEQKRHALMIALTAHGYRATETEYRPGHWRINAPKKSIVKYDGFSKRVSKTTDIGVFCIQVPNGRFFVEYDGVIHLTGNSRFDAYIDKKAKAFKGLITPELLWETDTHGIELSYYDKPPVHRFGDIWVHHGLHALTESGASVRKMVDDFGVSCIVGHCHRAGSYFKTYKLRNETLRGYELGHLTDVTSAGMSYDTKHNWQQGFAIAHIVNDHPHIQLVSIHDGVAVVDGKVFRVE